MYWFTDVLMYFVLLYFALVYCAVKVIIGYSSYNI